MKKIVFGKPQTKILTEQQADKLIKDLSQGQIIPLEKQVEMVIPEPVKETVIVETRTVQVEKIRMQDKLARRHSKLSRAKMEKALDEMCEVLEQQNIRLHALQHQLEKHDYDINAVRMQKPQEKQIVTEKTVIEKHIPKKLVYALIGSMLLNALILLTK